MKPRSFGVNIRSSCFLCLDKNGIKSSSQSLINLSRHLKINVQKLLHNLNASGQVESMEEELVAPLCSNCCGVVSKFDRLWHELELVRLKLNASVQHIHQLMTGVEQLIIPGNTKLLREEILQKCATQVNSFRPRVTLQKIRGAVIKRRLVESHGAAESNRSVRAKISKYTTLPEAEVSNQINEEVILEGEENELGAVMIKHETMLNSLEESDTTSHFVSDSHQDSLQVEDDQELGTNALENNPPPGPGKVKKYKKCGVCSKVVQIKCITKHLKTHSAKTHLLPCSHCPLRFPSEYSLERHTFIKHQTDVFADCRGHCKNDKVFQAAIAQLFDENSIQKLATGRDWSYPCKYCSRSYAYKPDTVWHMIKAHFEELSSHLKNIMMKAVTADASMEEVSLDGFRCTDCGLTMSSAQTLRSHVLRQHKGVKSHNCPECHMSFKETRPQRNHLMETHFMSMFKECNIQDFLVVDIEGALRLIVEKSVVMHHKNLFECKFCKKQYRFRKDISFHVVSDHRHAMVSKLVEGIPCDD